MPWERGCQLFSFIIFFATKRFDTFEYEVQTQWAIHGQTMFKQRYFNRRLTMVFPLEI